VQSLRYLLAKPTEQQSPKATSSPIRYFFNAWANPSIRESISADDYKWIENLYADFDKPLLLPRGVNWINDTSELQMALIADVAIGRHSPDTREGEYSVA
jgi:hypothetical protein